MITCTHCGSDDIALQESKRLDTAQTREYTFIVWFCVFFCHTCGETFERDLDEDERKDYL